MNSIKEPQSLDPSDHYQKLETTHLLLKNIVSGRLFIKNESLDDISEFINGIFKNEENSSLSSGHVKTVKELKVTFYWLHDICSKQKGVIDRIIDFCFNLANLFIRCSRKSEKLFENAIQNINHYIAQEDPRKITVDETLNQKLTFQDPKSIKLQHGLEKNFRGFIDQFGFPHDTRRVPTTERVISWCFHQVLEELADQIVKGELKVNEAIPLFKQKLSDALGQKITTNYSDSKKDLRSKGIEQEKQHPNTVIKVELLDEGQTQIVKDHMNQYIEIHHQKFEEFFSQVEREAKEKSEKPLPSAPSDRTPSKPLKSALKKQK